MIRKFTGTLARLTNSTVSIDQATWSWEHDNFSMSQTYIIWFSRTSNHIRFKSLKELSNYVERKIILFRKF